MIIRISTTLRSDFGGESEKALLPIALWEKRRAESELFAEMLRREKNKMAGAKTYSTAEMWAEAAKLLCGD